MASYQRGSKTNREADTIVGLSAFPGSVRGRAGGPSTAIRGVQAIEGVIDGAPLGVDRLGERHWYLGMRRHVILLNDAKSIRRRMPAWDAVDRMVVRHRLCTAGGPR